MPTATSAARRSKRPRPRLDLRAVLYREGAQWIAHCLEMDIAAEGATPRAALAALTDLCRFQAEVALEEGDLQGVFRFAPPELWRMFAMGIEAAGAGAGGPIHRIEARWLAVA